MEGPFGLGAVAVEFHAVVIRVVEVERLAHAVVGGTVEADAGLLEAAQGVCERGAVGIENGGVIESGVSGCWRAAAEAFPGVEADVVVVSARGEKRGGGAEALHDFKAEDIAVETDRAFQIRHLEVDVADADAGVDGGRVHAFMMFQGGR